VAPDSVSRRLSTFTNERSPGHSPAVLRYSRQPFGKLRRVVHGPALPPFDASVPLVQGGGVIVRQALQSRPVPCLEQVPDILIQLPLVLFHRQ